MVPVFRVSNLDKKKNENDLVGTIYNNHSCRKARVRNENNDSSILTWSNTLRNSKISCEDDYNA